MPSKKYKWTKIDSQTWMAENSAITEACPMGWHLPDTTEWNKLINYVGGYTVAGTKLKSLKESLISINGTSLLIHRTSTYSSFSCNRANLD